LIIATQNNTLNKQKDGNTTRPNRFDEIESRTIGQFEGFN